MASLDLVTSGGRNVWRVRAYIDKRRETISLGTFEEPEAVIAKEHIEHLIDAKKRNRLPLVHRCVGWIRFRSSCMSGWRR